MDTQAVSIEGKVYCDFPIAESDDALCTVELKCHGEITNMNLPPVNLCTLIDVSSSMGRSIPHVKATLLSLGNCIKEWKDRKVTLTLITFDTTAKVIFSGSVDDEDFESQVDSICADGYTNISDALTLASKYHSKNCLNGVVLLSDGNPNRGIIDFSELIDHKLSLFPDTEVITIGYGTGYNLALLSKLGRFTYAALAEDIPGIIGSYVGQLMTTFAVNATLSVDLPHEKKRAVIGSLTLGNLFADRVNFYGVAINDDETDEAIGKSITLTYDTFAPDGSLTSHTISSNFEDSREDDIPDNVTTLYYNASATRLIESFKVHVRNGNNSEGRRNFYRKRVGLWDRELGKEARKRVLMIIGDIPMDRDDSSYHEATISSASLEQIGYSNSNHQTPQQRKTSLQASNFYNCSVPSTSDFNRYNAFA